MATLAQVKRTVLDTYQAVYAQRLAQGTSGNVSARFDEGMVITPSGLPLGDTRAADMVHTDFEGAVLQGRCKPSSEWQMHAAVYQQRPDVHAVVHCHSRYATTLACAGKSLPAFHYMVAVSGRGEVPLAPYATFGSVALAEGVAAALKDGDAALMANHGLIACGDSAAKALAITAEIEEQCAVYWGTLAIGGAQILSDEEMGRVLEQFAGYGQSEGQSEDSSKD